MTNYIENESYYTPEELAERLKLSLSSVYKLIRSGELPHLRLGKVYRIPASDLRQYLGRVTKGIPLSHNPAIPKVAAAFLKEVQNPKWGKNIQEVWLYGSYARGDYDPDSDVDLLVVLRKKSIEASQWLSQITEVAMAATEYEELLSVKELEEQEWEKMKTDHYPFAQSIQEEGVLLWNHP